ncbi:unnamed protein product [Prorocentrum cordatum]|uniref:Uncharacterized protein n=1 Tax=Prorocentrum cordatum TaxID=2364126 RepID=A0ABN9V7N3_9DINO|nr:unnamed protein product [Polarella glacialis]
MAAAAGTDVARGYVWVLADLTSRHTIGTEIEGGAQVLRTSRGPDHLVQLGLEDSSETNGSQHTVGCPTAPVISKCVLRTGGVPHLWLREWMREKGIAEADRVTHEMRTLMKSLWLAGTTDQDNIGALLCIGTICRHWAGIVAAYAGSTEPACDLTRYFTGQMLAEDAVGPEMRSCVPRRAEEERETDAGGLRGSPAEYGVGGSAGDGADGGGVESSWRSEWRMRRPVHLIGWQGIERAKYPFPWMMLSGFFTSEFEDWHRAVQKLFDVGMVGWTMSPKCRIGLFCVLKSDGKSLRLIVDARRVNEVFADPPGVDLLTAEGFSRGEVALPAGMSPQTPEAVEYLSKLRELRKLRLVAGTSDVANCFHCLRLRPEMSAYFGLPTAPAHVFGLEGTATGPPLTALPPDTAAAQAQRYVYVDNLGILHTRRYEVGEAISSLQRHFAELGLVLHESAATDETCKTLGVELLGRGLRSRVTSDRWWLIRRSIEALLRRPKCSGWALEVVVGHCTFAGLANRGCLSAWHTVHAFMHKYRDGAGHLREECLQELRAFKGLMLFLEESDWARPWNPMAFETDSSVEEMGIAKAT